MDPIRRISIRARGMSNAAIRGRTHVSTRPYAQTKAQFSLASDGASTHVPVCPHTSIASLLVAEQGRHKRLIPLSNFSGRL